MKQKEAVDPNGPAVWRWAVGLSLLSGAAALGHQLLWTRRMIDLLGAGAESSSRVFGVFFLGLALGGALAFVLVKRIRSPWKWLAGAEIGIFLLALPIYFLPAWSHGVWPALGEDVLVGAAGGWFKLGLSVLLLLPPAFLMGWFLPVLASALLGGDRTLRRQGIRLYGWNTLGGVLGLAGTAAVFLPLFGGIGAFCAVLFLNGLTAAGCLYLHRRTRFDPGPGRAVFRVGLAGGADTVPRARPGAGVLLLGFFSGFGVLALEVAFLETIMLVAPLSFYAPAGILVCVILSLAVAAFAAGPLQRYGSIPWLLTGSLAAAGLAAGAAPLIFFGLAQLTGGLPPASVFPLFLLKLAAFCFAVCGPAFFLAGLTFPLLTAWSDAVDGDRRGRGWGLLLAANGLGGLCGAEAAYRWLLPGIGLYGSIWAVGVLYAVAAAVAGVFLGFGGRHRFPARIAAIGALAILLLLLQPVRSLTTVNPFMGLTVLEEWSGREGTVALVEREDFGRGLLVYNQYMLGTTGARHDQARQAHLPLVLHPEPRSVGFIGLATGITPGAALLHDEVEEVVAVELSRTVSEAARRYFSDHQHGLFSDDRVRVAIADGRTYVAAAPGRFDVVAGDLFLPWGPGEARLYSREHFESVRDSLKPGGLYCQWLPLYQLTSEQLEVIVRTFGEVFPEAHLFLNGFRSDTAALAVVGFRDGGAPDWDAVAERTRAVRDSGGVADVLIRWREGIELLYLGPAKSPGPGPVHTLSNMHVELAAGRERVTGDPAEKFLTGERLLAAVRRLSKPSTGEIGTGGPEFAEALDLLIERDVLRRRGERFPEQSRRRLQAILPSALPEDREADPAAWPGS